MITIPDDDSNDDDHDSWFLFQERRKPAAGLIQSMWRLRAASDRFLFLFKMIWRLRWCDDDDDDYVGTEDEGGYCVEDYYDHYNYDQEIYKVEVDDHSTRPLANGAVSKASWPTQILARCQILNKGTWHYSDDWAILNFFPMTDPMIDPMTGPKAGSLKKKFWILKNA